MTARERAITRGTAAGRPEPEHGEARVRAFIDRNYSRASWRRTRSALSLAQSMFDPRLYPNAPLVEAYWWDGHPNFGDALTPWLLRHRGIIPVHAEFQRAKVVGVGSLIQFIPPDFAGLIWGSGLISDSPTHLPDVEALAVRGPLTRDALSASDGVALGDPGLLASRVLPRPPVRHRLGIVPHGSHFENSPIADFAARYPREVALIDVTRRPSVVIREIASCSAIVSTSLHGVIIADSYGIPACWSMIEPVLIGGDFKFRDHEAVVNSPGRTRRFTFTPDMTPDHVAQKAERADPDRVSAAIDELENSVAQLRLRFAHTRRSPLRSWEALVARKV